MKSVFFKIWQDSVWSQVIAAVIAAAIIGVIVFLWRRASSNAFFSFKKKAVAPLFNAEEIRTKIEKAVYEKRNITGLNLVWTGIRNDNNFLEFCLKDFSETWLIQETPDPVLTNEIKRQIKIVNRHLAASEMRHNRVIIILLVCRKLTIDEKTNLYNQLVLFHARESLISKITFQVWDKTDIDKVLED